MRSTTWFSVAFAALAIAACDRAPTQADVGTASLAAVNPATLEFNATQGLPDAPFHVSGHGSRGDERGEGKPFPDSLKLTTEQRVRIQAIRDSFALANKADLDSLKAIHQHARTAHKAGASHDSVKVILDAAKPILERMHARFVALKAAVEAVLTPEQKAWLDAHRCSKPPRDDDNADDDDRM